MKLVRLCTLSHNDSNRIRARQLKGTMTTHTDGEGYLCYNESELKSYKPTKSGRPKRKITKE